MNLCRGLLRDKNIDDTVASAPVLPEPPALIIGNGSWLSSVDATRESPYLVPGKANFQRMLLIVKSRLAEWQDYALAMREDPQFYVNVVGEWSEHSTEWIRDENGKRHRDLTTTLGKEHFWDRTITSAINEIYEGLFMWNFFNDQLETIASFREQDDHKEDAPAYLQAVNRLRSPLERRVIHKARTELMRQFPSSPPNRSLFVNYSGEKKLRLRNPINRKDELWWILNEISTEESLCPLDVLAAELNRLIQTERKQKDRTTAFVARFIADLGLECEFRSHLKLLCPRVFVDRGKSLGVKLEEEKKLQDWMSPRLQPMTDLMRATAPAWAGHNFIRLGRDGDPTSGRFNYPVEKRQTKENNEATSSRTEFGGPVG